MASAKTSHHERVDDPENSTMPLGKSGIEDDESEWEYEYSMTETETYYVTLDLSKADFVSRMQKTVANGRGGYKEKLLGEAFAGKLDDDEVAPPNVVGADDDDVGEEGGAQSVNESGAPDQVQILDIHSVNPLISYKGRLYEGQWSENITTELLMTRRDDENPLPALRQLDNNVDLLAASSARITVTEKQVKPREDNAKRRQRRVMFDEDDYEISEDEVYQNKDVPRPEPGASAHRVEQGNFLANLIAVKKRKGEKDEVTVVAQTQETFGRPQPRGPPGRRKGEGKATPRGKTKAKPKGSGRGRGRGRSRGQRGGPPGSIHTAKHESAIKVTSTDLDGVIARDSRPTPGHWSELRGDKGEMEVDGDEAIDEDRDDNSVHDEAGDNSTHEDEDDDLGPEDDCVHSTEEDSDDEMDVDT